MPTNFTMKAMLALLLISSATTIHATTQIECPPSKLVTANYAKLDTIHITPKQAYVVYSESNSIYQEDAKRYWSISTMVGGADFNDAFDIAVENVKSVNVQWDKYAKKFDGYYCKYTGTDVSRIVYLVTQEEGRGANLAHAMTQLSN